MRRDYRDGRGRHAGDPGGLSDGARLPPRALLDRLARESGDAFVSEVARDRTGLEGLQPLEPFLLPPYVALVADPRLNDRPLLARELARYGGGAGPHPLPI